MSQSISDLAALVFEMVELAQNKFRDPDTSHGPPYIVSFHVRESFEIGYYMPILQHWGIDQTEAIIYGDQGIALSATHEDAWRFLSNDWESPTQDVLFLKGEGEWKAINDGIRPGQIFFVRDMEDLRNLRLEEKIISGGTRTGRSTMEKLIRRPWAVPIHRHFPERCPFCLQIFLEGLKESGNCLIFPSIYTLYPWHWMIVPKKEFLSKAGELDNGYEGNPFYGPQFLKETMDHALNLAGNRLDPKYPAIFGVQIGPSAGQTMSHFHAHLYQCEHARQ